MRPSALPCATLLCVCRCSVMALLATFAGCGGSGESSNTTPPPNGSFELSVSTNSISVIAGQQSGTTITVTPVNGFSGTVSLAVSTLPNGVSGSFSVNPIAVGQSAELVLQTQPSTSQQSVSFQITGTAGSLSKNQSLTLTVVAPASLGSRSTHVYFDGFLREVIYDPVHKLVFCANTELNEVEVVSTTTQTITNVLKIPQPYAMDVTPDGSTLWVGTTGEFLYAVDLASMEVVQRITPRAASPPVTASSSFPVTTVRALATTANGSLLLRLGQVNVTTEALYQYFPSTGHFVDRSKEASTMRFFRSADGSKVLLGTWGPVTVYDSASDTFQSTNTASGSPLAAMRPDGSQIATLTQTGLAFLSSQLQLQATISVGSTAGTPVYSRDGKFVYFPEDISIIRTKPTMAVLDSSTLQMVGEVPDLFLTQDTGPCSLIDVCAEWTPGGTTLFTSEETGLLIGSSPVGLSFLDTSNPTQLPAAGPRLNVNYPYSANPSLGSSSQNTNVVLTGVNLGGASVAFGTQSAAVLSVSSDQTQLTVVSPNSPVTGPVNILAKLPNNWLTLAPLAFSYGPQVEYFMPMGDAPSGGSQLTILGYGFGTDSAQIKVSIGGNAAQVVGSSLVNGSLEVLHTPLYGLSVIVPPGTSGAADLVVSTPAGSTTLPHAFHYFQGVSTLTLGSNFTQVLYDSTRKYVYLLDPVAKQVDVVVPASSQVVATAPTGNKPTAMTLTPDASILAVANQGDNTVSLINPDHPAIPKIVSTKAPPNQMAATSTGKLLLDDGEAIDLSTGVSSSANYGGCGPAGAPIFSAVADGSKIFVALTGNSGGGVCVYTPATNSVSNLNELQDFLSESVAAGDGNRWVLNDQYILDYTNSVESQLSISPLIVGGTPSAVHGSVVHASGGLFYLPLMNGLHIYDLVHAKLVRSYGGLQLSPGAVKTIALDDLGQTLFAISPAGLQIAKLDSVPLSIGNVSPSIVGSGGGAELTIRGSGFTSNTVVSIAGSVIASNFVDGNTLQVTLPMLKAGTAQVSVLNPDGSSFALEGVLLVQ
jgi:hypothetical protein